MRVGKIKKIISCLLAVVMLGSLVYSTDVIKAEGATNQEIDHPNISLKKTAQWNDQYQQATIRMEAYTEGKITVNSIPADIVLVLDTSGSMDESIGTVTYYEESFGNIDIYQLHLWDTELYYQDDNGTYHRVYVERTGDGVWNYMYRFYMTVSGKNIYLSDFVDGWTSSNDLGLTLYKKVKRNQSRMEALKIAVKKFIDDTKLKNDSINDESQKHRIAIVRFSDKNRAQALCDLTPVNESTSNTLKGYVSKLDADGGTYPNDGLDIANKLFNYRLDRNRVAIMFTDGGPGGTTNNPFNSTVAKSTINSSKTLKDKGVKVYSVGVFKDANPNDVYKEFNGYMHGVSSNYPHATGYEVGFDKYHDTGHLNERVENSNYYLAASNSDELLNIFEDINEDIDSGTTLDVNSYVSDVISNNFVLPKGAESVRAYTEKVTGKNSQGEYTFDVENHESIDSSNITYDPDTREVKVKGFDYNQDFIRKEKDTYKGKRLVIEITLKPIDGFIGGNQISTNDEASIKDSSGVKHEEEDVNTIDIPIKYDFDNKDAAIYVGSDWNKIERFFNITEDENGNHVITYKNDRNEDRKTTNYIIDGINNEFVDITYTVKTKNMDGAEETVGTYKIYAGQTTGAWEKSIDLKSKEKRNCEEYYVSVEVAPKNSKSPNNETDIFANKINVTKDSPSVLHIVKPTIDLKDDIVFLGNNSQLNSLVSAKEDWNDIGNHSITDLEIEGQKDLTYEYKLDSGPKDTDDISNQYTPDKTGTAVFEVIVKNNGKNITVVTDFNSVSYGENNKFKVDVIGGTISLNKELLNLDTKPVDPNDGNPIFIFRIERLENGKVTDTYYRYVKMIEREGTYVPVQDIPDLVGLKKGDYRITEESTLRFKPTNRSTWQYGNENASTFSGASVDVKINEDKPTVNVKYVNEVKSDDYDSDNGILVNKFELNDNKKIEVNKWK